jgi:hypothetical protein
MKSALFALVLLATLAGAAYAGCALDAYNKACSGCSFDANGMVDKSCQQGYQSAGTACVSSSYPIMSGKYASGQCPQVDACASELRACTAQFSSGSDKENCQEGSVSVCYSSADECVKQAAIKCGEVEKQCGTPATFLLLIVGSVMLFKRKG